jgi:hypothetical protein
MLLSWVIGEQSMRNATDFDSCKFKFLSGLCETLSGDHPFEANKTLSKIVAQISNAFGVPPLGGPLPPMSP